MFYNFFPTNFFYQRRKSLTLFRMGCSRMEAQGGGGGAKRSPPKICHTYPTMMNLDTVISYLKKFQKLYESLDTPLGFC